MFTPSTPASFNRRIESSIFFASTPFGGKTSTEVTNPPSTIFLDHFERSSGGTTFRSAGGTSVTWAKAPEEKMTFCARGDAALTASEISFLCAGVVPQQPPMNFAPDCMNRLANFDMYSGEHM